MWVRGLKLKAQHRAHSRATVAPYVGAWIETSIAWLPTAQSCRTLCGCVD